MAVAVQRKPTVTNIESIPVLGEMLKGLKVADAFRLKDKLELSGLEKSNTFQDTESSKCLNPHTLCIYIALIPKAVPESYMKLCFGFTRKEVVGLISTCTANLKQHEQKQLFSRWKICIQSETVVHSGLRIEGGEIIIQ